MQRFALTKLTNFKPDEHVIFGVNVAGAGRGQSPEFG